MLFPHFTRRIFGALCQSAGRRAVCVAIVAAAVVFIFTVFTIQTGFRPLRRFVPDSHQLRVHYDHHVRLSWPDFVERWRCGELRWAKRRVIQGQLDPWRLRRDQSTAITQELVETTWLSQCKHWFGTFARVQVVGGEVFHVPPPVTACPGYDVDELRLEALAAVLTRLARYVVLPDVDMLLNLWDDHKFAMPPEVGTATEAEDGDSGGRRTDADARKAPQSSQDGDRSMEDLSVPLFSFARTKGSRQLLLPLIAEPAFPFLDSEEIASAGLGGDGGYAEHTRNAVTSEAQAKSNPLRERLRSATSSSPDEEVGGRRVDAGSAVGSAGNFRASSGTNATSTATRPSMSGASSSRARNWKRRRNAVVWRGSDTGWVHADDPRFLRDTQRGRLCVWLHRNAAKYGSILDFALVESVAARTDVNKEVRAACRFAPALTETAQERDFNAQLLVDGNSAAWRIVRILVRDMLTVVVESCCETFVDLVLDVVGASDEGFQQTGNAVGEVWGVDSGLATLDAVLDRLETDPEAAMKTAALARAFALSHLNDDAQMCYTAELLVGYAGMWGGPVSLHRDARRVVG